MVERFFSGTGFSYDRVVSVCTTGFDGYWKRRILKKVPADALRILDQASGTGIFTFMLARAHPKARITGVELRDEYLSVAKKAAAARGLAKVDFLLGRAEEVAPEGEFDCITSSYLAKYADLPKLIANCAKMLRPGGMIVLHDFTYPRGPFARLLWRVYFGGVSIIGRLFFPEWRTVFRELPEFLAESSWVEQTCGELKRQGFVKIEVMRLTMGAAAIVSAVSPPRRTA